MRRTCLLVVALAITPLVGACGADDSNDDSAPTAPAVTTSNHNGPSDAEPSSEQTAVSVVKAWSAALNAGDNEAAAALFAPNARVIQAAGAIPLIDQDAARRFNEALPCSGRVLDLTLEGDVVTAVFELGNRDTSLCDAPPGTIAAAEFVIRSGKIAAWQVVPVPAEDPSAPHSAV
jgi:hypothetical protein